MTAQAVREPPILTDKQVYSYLQEMARQINYALQQIDSSVATGASADGPIAKMATQAAEKAMDQQVQTVRSMIIQTATNVRTALAEFEAHMEGEYVAQSYLGTVRDEISSDIQAAADGIEQKYQLDTVISELKEGSASFQDYQYSTSQYIRTGLLYYDGNDARVGVAVGENFTYETDPTHGEPVLKREKLCATFTSNRLSFWQGGVEVAYVSNSQLYIPSANVTGTLRVGQWEFFESNGLIIKYVG